jgi:autotransporter-associated beta strand protein
MSVHRVLSGRSLAVALSLLSTVLVFVRSQAMPAFPGALGFGANATGGRAGSVYHVTTLADSGPGSFRDAVSSANRIVVFDVGGYISLATAVSVNKNITIAGQTAPGGGIGFKGGEISFANRSNIICRYIRVRPGSDTASSEDDCLSFYRARNIICDHVSLEFGPWNNVGAVSDDWQNYPVTEVTFQNCLNADPTGQKFGAHTESVSSTMSWFYTIFANAHGRNPMSKINDVFVNNVLYNCELGYTTHTSTEFSHDIVSNYFIAGPLYGSSTGFPWYQIDANQSIYYSGNLFDGDEDGTLDGSVTIPYWYSGTGTILSAPWSPLTTSIPIYSPATAYRIAVSQAGTLPRDQVDDLVISQVKTLGNGTAGTGAGTTGGLYGSQTATGLGNNGYGVINGGIAPADSDGDGMPDYWEKAVGLNYLSTSDVMTIATDGYANIEHYLNWLADPHALTVTNSSVDVDLWQHTSGFTNASPVYVLDNATNGAVTLNSGHIAHFTPATNFFGLAGFRFWVTASDGTAWTNTVSVLVTPHTQSSTTTLTWRGDGVANLWAVASGTNWFNGTNLVAFTAGDTVTFDDSGSNTPALNLSGILPAGNVYVLAAQDYTFGGSGAIAGSAALFKNGPGRLTLNTVNTFSGGTFIGEGVVQLGDGTSVSGSISGNITNNDTLIFANPATVSSSGSISGPGVLIKRGAGTLTLSGTQTYTNLTTIEAGTLTFSGTPPPGDVTNNGTLGLNLSSSMTYAAFVSGPGNVNVNASSQTTTFSNTNTYSGGTTNSNGTLQLANNHAVGTGPATYLAGAVKVGNGVVITNTFVLPSSTSDLMLDSYGGGSGTWAGDIVVVGGGASFRPGGTDGKLVLTGTAAMGGRNFIIPKGSVDLAGTANFSATGTATAFGRNDTANSAFVTIKNNAVVSLGKLSLGGAANTGGRVTLTLQDNASLSTGIEDFDVHNSTRTATWTSVTLNGGTLTAGGIIKTKTGSAQLTTNFFNGGILKASKNNGAFLPALSGLTAYVQAGGAKIDDGGFAITIAAPLLHDPALGATLDGGLVKLGAGTLTLSGANTYTGGTTVSNGTLALAASGSIAGSTNVAIAAGATFDVSAPGGFTLASGRTLSGSGSVNGNFTIAGDAILAPGSSAGTLTFSNNLILNSSSVLNFELGAASDRAVVNGTLTSGGKLYVTGLAGFGAGAYTLFNYVGFSGSLPTLSSTPAGYSCSLTNTGSAIQLLVVSTNTMPPVFGGAGVSGGSLVFSGSNGTPLGNYFLLASTNVALPLSNWTRLTTNQFDAGGNFAFTNVPSLPRSFFRLQMP